MNRLVRSVLLLAVVIWTAGCPERTKIPIGVIYSLTGPNGTAGTNQYEAALAAVEAINEAGGVLGSDLEIHLRDDASNAANAGEAATDLIQNVGVKGIIGSNPSANTLAISAVAVPAKVVQISSGSTSERITNEPDDNYLYRTVPSERYQYRLQAQRARAKNFTKVAILYVPGLQGETPAAAFDQAFIEFGGQITFKQPWVANQSSYVGYLNMVFGTVESPQACTLIGPVTDSAQVIRDYVDSFITRGVFWFFMNAQNQDFVTSAGPSDFTFQHEGTRPTVRAANDRWGFFNQKYRDLYNRESNNYGESNAFDAVYLLALAMEAAGPTGLTTEPERIRDQVVPISRGGTAYGPAEFRQAASAAARGEDIDYQGASGDVDFDDRGDVLGGFDIWQVQNGEQVNIETDIPPPP